MKISFSIVDSSWKISAQNIIKTCDLVFIFADLCTSGDEDYRWMQENIDQSKCLSLTSGLNRSDTIIRYMVLRADGKLAPGEFVGGEAEVIELNTIYESLPKGIPLTLHSWASQVCQKEATIIIIPHEN